MFIGRIGSERENVYRTGLEYSKKKVQSPIASKRIFRPRTDYAEIGSDFRGSTSRRIYRPNMRKLSVPTATSISPSDKRVISPSSLPSLAPSEQSESEYTKEEALVRRYMRRQPRLEGYFTDDSFVQTSVGPPKMVVRDRISESDLEEFQKELMEKGLGSEIDWVGLRADMLWMDINFGNVEYFGQKTDYLASRYVVLKDRIETEFAGEQQESELQKLEKFYLDVKEEMADSYAKNIGGFYENLGQSGVADDMRRSVLSLIDKKADIYTAYSSQNDIYAELSAPSDQWLKQDDGYMAARLREMVSAKTDDRNSEVPYGENDLSYAGTYTKEFFDQLKNPKWDTYEVKKSDSDLGIYLAKTYDSLDDKFEKAGLSKRLSAMLKDTFIPFMERFVDAVDSKIDRNKAWVLKHPWQSGLIRTHHIDRESVYRAFRGEII